MRGSLEIHPERLRQFGAQQGVTFVLVVTPDIADIVSVEHGNSDYAAYQTITLEPGCRFDDMLGREIPEQTHILAICPGSFFESPSPQVLGPRRKLMAMACNSTPASTDVIRHFLGVMERTDPDEQAAFSDTFFELLEESAELVYVDAKRGTRATLQHLNDDLVWNQQAGPLEWGEQQIVPSGEISVLPIEITEFHEDLHLPLAGDIVIRGYPILHNGTPSFTRTDQRRIHEQLKCLNDHAVIAHVEKGTIIGIEPADDGAKPAVDMLNAMFEVDARYRKVWEIGHALNTSLDLLPGNHAMNEVYGATEGCLHWGLGLTPYTQYHLDIISPDTTVQTDRGTIVLGVKNGYASDRMATPDTP
jgi:hypothetical protein